MSAAAEGIGLVIVLSEDVHCDIADVLDWSVAHADELGIYEFYLCEEEGCFETSRNALTRESAGEGDAVRFDVEDLPANSADAFAQQESIFVALRDARDARKVQRVSIEGRPLCGA